MSMDQRFVVIGPGAIGGAVAALLSRAGQNVTLVCKKKETALIVSTQGMKVRGVKGHITQPLPAVTSIEELEGAFDYALIAVKAYDLQETAQRILPFLKPDSLAVSLQNGICVDTLAEVVGRERTVGCVVGWGSTLAGPADIEITSSGELVIGMLKNQHSHKLQFLKEALDAVFPVRIARDIYAELYSKLIINSCITSLGAVSGLLLGPMMGRRDCRALFIRIITEAMDVAKAIGLTVPAYKGQFDYYTFLSGEGAIAGIRRSIFLRVFGSKYRRLKSSSLQSLERGGRTEIDYFNGYLVRKAVEAGVAVPLNARITAMIKEIEAGTRPISPANLAEL